MKIRGREYADYDEYLDEREQYWLDTMREGRFEKEEQERIERKMEEEADNEIADGGEE
jgi:hypothetical protein